jgi:hypothetical protein
MNQALVPIVFLALAWGFDAICLVDLRRRRGVRYMPKAWWAFFIVFFTPIGGLAYLNTGGVD